MNFKYKFNRLKHLVFGEKFYKKLNIDWKSYPSRLQVIQHIIDLKNYNYYLEIGCFKDDVFSNIIINNKVGVDPISGGNVRSTSDVFFKNNKKNFDIIFIDGLHHYKQVKKDIENSLLFLNEHGIVVLHDTLPRNYIEQATPQSKGTWTGDVWKNIVECRANPNLQIYTVFADHGISLLQKKPNNNLLNFNATDYEKLPFKDFFHNYKLFLNLIFFDEIKKFV